MGVALNDFWRQILWSSTECGCRFSRIGEELGEAKVSQFDIAILVYQHVLWLQVSVDNLVLVEDTDSQDQLGGVELDCFLREALDLEQIGVKIATPDIFEEEVDSVFILEDIVHTEQEWMI